MIVVKSKVGQYVRNCGMNVSSEVSEELEKQVMEMLKKACNRAKLNGRKTVYARDL